MRVGFCSHGGGRRLLALNVPKAHRVLYLRHGLSYGLLHDGDPYGHDAIYGCWLIFQLCVLPLFPYRIPKLLLWANADYGRSPDEASQKAIKCTTTYGVRSSTGNIVAGRAPTFSRSAMGVALPA